MLVHCGNTTYVPCPLNSIRGDSDVRERCLFRAISYVLSDGAAVVSAASVSAASCATSVAFA